MANADGHVGYFLRMDGRMRHAVHGSLGRTGRFSSVVARAATRYGRSHGVEHLSYRPVPARDARNRRSAIRTCGDRAFGIVRARSEEHTSELQSLMRISYAVFCLKKKKIHHQNKSKYKNRQGNITN